MQNILPSIKWKVLHGISSFWACDCLCVWNGWEFPNGFIVVIVPKNTIMFFYFDFLTEHHKCALVAWSRIMEIISTSLYRKHIIWYLSCFSFLSSFVRLCFLIRDSTSHLNRLQSCNITTVYKIGGKFTMPYLALPQSIAHRTHCNDEWIDAMQVFGLYVIIIYLFWKCLQFRKHWTAPFFYKNFTTSFTICQCNLTQFQTSQHFDYIWNRTF